MLKMQGDIGEMPTVWHFADITPSLVATAGAYFRR